MTFHFFRTPNGRSTGFNFSVCFPPIYNVHADSTNSTYTHIAWNTGGYSGWYLDYFQTRDMTRSTHHDTVNYTPFRAPQALASGTEYTYHIRPRYNYWYSEYTYDTSDYCYAPPHKFRTPKVANCNTCGHNRECIEYNNFYAEQVICYKGNTNQPDSAECVSPTQHTVVTDTVSGDPRTGSRLRMVPSGDTASVRLGNPENGHGGESILYEIHVDTNDYDLMVLRYAPVLRLLNTKLKHQKPRFSFRLFDENCIPIQPLCYSRDILDDDNTTGWDTSSYSIGGNTDIYIWKNWKSIGIDIAAFHGKTIYLQLSTCDGTSTGSAYAYFTLHCARKQIDHLQQCSDNIANTFYAPEGFNYRWYNADRPDSTLSTTNALAVTDSGLYQCWVSPEECFDQSCGYTISALAVPRYPHANFDSIITTSSCSFNVRFINRSHIADADGNPLWTNEDCETAFWDFGNGQTSTNYNAEAVYTAAGTYTVRLIVSIAGGQCTDTITKRIRLVWAHQTPRLEGNRTLCPAPNRLYLTMYNTTSCRWEYTYDGESYSDNGTELDLNDVTNQTVHCYVSDSNECDYHYELPITILPQYNYTDPRTICASQLSNINGWVWRGHHFYEGTTSGEYYYPDTTVNGCDSNVTLRLTVNDVFNRYQEFVFCDYTTSFPYPPNSPNPVVVYDSTGLYHYTFSSVYGCDSIIHITMRQHVVDHDTIRDNVCSGYAYDTLDFHFSAAQNASTGTTTVTHTATEQIRETNQIQTCDSTMTLILTVNPHSQNQRSIVRTENQLPLVFNGVSFYHDIDTTFHLTNRYGCDSALLLHFHVNLNTETHLYDTVCDNVLPHTWDGITFDSAGTIKTSLQRSNGTDSNVFRHLTVHPTFSNTTRDTICADSSVTFCGTTYTLANTYTHHLATVCGCDSTETLVLTVHPTRTTTLTETICDNSPYDFCGTALNTSGTYNRHLQTVNGCDSSVTLNLTALPVSESTVRDTILENELSNYSFLGHTFQGDVQDYIIVITNHAGCDSIIHFWLTVNWNQANTVERTICRDLLTPSYNWDGTLFTPADLPSQGNLIVKTITLTDINGADSTVTRRLTVNPIYDEDYPAVICDDATYTFSGTVYNTTGDYTHNLTTVDGCDSTVTLHLTVNAVTYSTIDTTILENALTAFRFNGHSFNSAVTNQLITVTNAAGCDSIITFTLHVIPNVSTLVDSTICASTLPLTWNGKTFTASGAQSALLHTADGADSTVTMTVTVNPIYDDTTRVTICDNQQTTFNGVSYNHTCTHTDTLTTSQGCDSVTTLVLTVNPTHVSEFSDTTCDNQPYTFGGAVRGSEGDHVHTFANIYQCDSTVTLHLHIDSVTHSSVAETIVQNDLPHTFNGVTYTLAQMEAFRDSHPGEPLADVITITNAAGCDSVISHTLTVNWNQHTTVYQSICDNQFPLDWDGTAFVQSDHHAGDTVIVKEVTLADIDGADSIVTRRLHVFPTYATSFADTICDDNTYTYNSNTYTVTGNYPNTLQSIDHCDSIVTLQLTVNAVTYSDLFDTIVENQMPYSLNGQTYTLPQTSAIAPLVHFLRDTVTITNVRQCDSIIDLRLYVHMNVYDTVDSTICNNLLPLQWNARLFSGGNQPSASPQAGTLAYQLDDTLTAWTGADSILTMRLHVNPTYSLHFYDTICNNEQVTFNETVYNTAGSYPHPMTSSLQCDSLETLHLTVFGTSAATISDTIVENRLRQAYTFNGVLFDTLLFGPDQLLTPRFSRRDSTIIITNQIGCDSTIHYSLCVHWNVAATADSTICENYLPLQWNHRLFTGDISTFNPQLSTFNLDDTLTAYTGADSLLTMRLHVDTNTHSNIPDTVLENALPHTFNGVTYTLAQMETFRDSQPQGANGTLLDTITVSNARGCDSVIHHALFIRWNKTTDLVDTICENALPYSWQGRTIIVDTLFTSHSSPFTIIDTIIYTAVGGEDSLVVMHLHVKRNSRSTLFDTIVENQMDYQWNGVTFIWDDTTYIDQRRADLQHTGIIPNAAGCDSIAAMNLMVWLNRTASADSSICENFLPFTWNDSIFTLEDFLNSTTQQINKSTLILTTHGADSLLTMNVTELFNSYSADIDTIVENALAWNYNGYIFSHSHFGDTAALRTPPSSLTYIDSTVIIANHLQCDSLISYRLNVWWNVRTHDDDTLCDNLLPHTWNARTFTMPFCQSEPIEGRWHRATLYDTLTAWSGADSILAMHLHVMPTFDIHFADTVCESSYIAWYGDTLYDTGVYPMAFHTVDGCDSIEYLHFANYPNYDLVYYDTICDYSGTMRLGVEYLGMAHMPTMHGCDSNEVYHLWGMPVSYSTVDTIVSEHQIPFAYNGEWFADSGTTAQRFVLTNQYGCDSIINFTITVMPTVRQTIDSSICDSQLPLDWDGALFTVQQLNNSTTQQLVIIDTLSGAYGADSIVTRRLHVSPSYSLTYVDTTCNGSPYPFGDSLYTQTGIYVHTYPTTVTDPVYGLSCDSIETLHLQVNAMSYATFHDTIVENQLPHTFGGVTFTTTDEIIDSTIIILNTVACDSVITYSLHVFPNTYVNKDTTLCDNQLPFAWDGRMVTHGGLDSVVVLMPDGTDSVTRYWTVVNPTYNFTDTVQRCDSYEWIDGVTYTASTITGEPPVFHMTSVDGCDSVRNLALTLYYQTTTHDSIQSCDPYTWIDSNTYAASISGPTHLLQTVHGCDSTVVLEFTRVNHVTTNLFDTICRGVRYPFGGGEYGESGIYSDSLLTTKGCDSVVLLNLHVLEPPTIEITWEHDCDTRIYTITGHCDVPWFEWSSFPDDPALTGHTHDRTIQVRPTTHETYLFHADYKDVPTCPSSDTVNLSPLLRPHALIEYTPEFLTYDQLHLSAISRCTNEETRRWTVNGNDMGDQERIGYLADPRTDDSVVVELTAHHGICHDTDLVVIPFRKAAIWAPNAFTPGESSNNQFFVRYLGITDYSIDLYTRGGVLVWHSNDMNEGWDGTYQGKPCPQATYVWIVHYRDVTAPKNLLSKKGTVTLLR